MWKSIGAVLVGIAFVAGGFFAGGFVDIERAAAEDETAVVEAADQQDARGPRTHRRPIVHMVEAAAEYLGLEPAEVLEALADGQVLADLTDHDAGLVAAIVEAAEADIDQAVADGRISAERAEEIKDGLTERIETFVTTPHERPDHDRPFPDRHVRGFLKEAADVIGIDVRDLVEGLAEGKSIADVAAEHGVSEGNLVAHLTNAARDRIEEAVNRTR